jgi:hypothetical protein
MKYFSLFIFTLFSLVSYSQVGIGTTSPSAELEIASSDSGIPALELNAQSSPIGTITGQIAVIGDKLFMYDDTRAKWLSVETAILNFGYSGSANSQVLYYGGVELTGPVMPLDGTIVYVTANSSGGRSTKKFDLKINGTNVGNDDSDPTLDGRFKLASNTFSYSDYNIDFNAGDYISVKSRNNNNGVVSVDDPIVVIWVKWRK